MTPDLIDAARVALAGGQSRAAVARTLGISRDTLYRHLPAPDRSEGAA